MRTPLRSAVSAHAVTRGRRDPGISGRAASLHCDAGIDRFAHLRNASGHANYRRPIRDSAPPHSHRKLRVHAWQPTTTHPARPTTTPSRSRPSRSAFPTSCRARRRRGRRQPSGFELPGADLSDLELDVVVLPAQEDEFTCVSCFLVKHQSQLDHEDARAHLHGVRGLSTSRTTAARRRERGRESRGRRSTQRRRRDRPSVGDRVHDHRRPSIPPRIRSHARGSKSRPACVARFLAGEHRDLARDTRHRCAPVRRVSTPSRTSTTG